MTTWLPAFLVLNDLCFKLLCDKHNCLCYYKNDISENDFCGNESIFKFYFTDVLPIIKLITCKIDN